MRPKQKKSAAGNSICAATGVIVAGNPIAGDCRKLKSDTTPSTPAWANRIRNYTIEVRLHGLTENL